MPVERIPVNSAITADEWRERFVHAANKLALVAGLNNQERQWARDAGYNVPDEIEAADVAADIIAGALAKKG